MYVIQNRRDLVILNLPRVQNVAVCLPKAHLPLHLFYSVKNIWLKNFTQQQPRYRLLIQAMPMPPQVKSVYKNAEATCSKLAELTGVQSSQILPFSTGVIWWATSNRTFAQRHSIPLNGLNAESLGWCRIRHYDHRHTPKVHLNSLSWMVWPIPWQGISRVQAWIRPKWRPCWVLWQPMRRLAVNGYKDLLQTTVEHSFNRITIDGDTSTNDSCIFVAWISRRREISLSGWPRYQQVLDVLCPDYESSGAVDCPVMVRVRPSSLPFRLRWGKCSGMLWCCLCVAESPLIKTALFVWVQTGAVLWWRLARAGVPIWTAAKGTGLARRCTNLLRMVANPDYTEEAGGHGYEKWPSRIDLVVAAKDTGLYVWFFLWSM